MNDIYTYHIYNFMGNEIWNITFLCYDTNENGSYDEDDEYLFDDIEISKKQWDELTAKYLYSDSEGDLKIQNEMGEPLLGISIMILWYLFIIFREPGKGKRRNEKKNN